MSLVIFLVAPAFWALNGKLLGLALTASLFYSERGRRLGKRLSRCCVPLFPAMYLAAVVLGMRGDARHGVTLFGSSSLADWALTLSYAAALILMLYAGAIYVIRDLTLGHESRAS